MDKVPAIGMGVTRCVGSDRFPFTVIAIKSPKRIVVQEDNYRRTDNNGMSESQTYEFTPNPDGPEYTLTLRSNGRWVEVGTPAQYGGWYIGDRDAHYDPHF